MGDKAVKRRLVDESNEQTVILKTGFPSSSGSWLTLNVNNFYKQVFTCRVLSAMINLITRQKQTNKRTIMTKHKFKITDTAGLVTGTRFNQ